MKKLKVITGVKELWGVVLLRLDFGGQTKRQDLYVQLHLLRCVFSNKADCMNKHRFKIDVIITYFAS